LTLVLWKICLVAYAASAAFVFWFIKGRDRRAQRWSRLCALAGFLAQSAVIIWGVWSGQRLPVTSLSGALHFLSWCVVAAYLVAAWRYSAGSIGVVAMPMAATMWALGGPPRFPSTVAAAVDSHWLTVHGLLSFAGEATLATAFGAGLLYLVQERRIKTRCPVESLGRLPSLEVLDELNYRCLSIGFLLLTGGIVTGAIWASQVWGSYWSWQAKETWGLITWLVYAGLLHQRLNAGWRGKRAATMAVLGFLLVLFTFAGAGLMGSGPHRFDRFQG
jgi:cytochrome c-type biogenesis protein CcsB